MFFFKERGVCVSKRFCVSSADRNTRLASDGLARLNEEATDVRLKQISFVELWAVASALIGKDIH